MITLIEKQLFVIIGLGVFGIFVKIYQLVFDL